MSRYTILIPLLMIGLSACEPTEIGPGAESSRETRNRAPDLQTPIKLPPSIVASKQYRCTDNSLVFVDYYSDDVSASIRTTKDGPSTRLTSSTAGGKLIGEGFSLTGDRKAQNVTVTTPAHSKPLNCHL